MWIRTAIAAGSDSQRTFGLWPQARTARSFSRTGPNVTITSMGCGERQALMIAYRTAVDRYDAATETLERAMNADRSDSFQDLKQKTIDARLAYQLAREELRVHRESHGAGHSYEKSPWAQVAKATDIPS